MGEFRVVEEEVLAEGAPVGCGLREVGLERGARAEGREEEALVVVVGVFGAVVAGVVEMVDWVVGGVQSRWRGWGD